MSSGRWDFDVAQSAWDNREPDYYEEDEDEEEEIEDDEDLDVVPPVGA